MISPLRFPFIPLSLSFINSHNYKRNDIILFFIDLIMLLLMMIQYCYRSFFKQVDKYITPFNYYTPHLNHFHSCESCTTRFIINVISQFNPLRLLSRVIKTSYFCQSNYLSLHFFWYSIKILNESGKGLRTSIVWFIITLVRSSWLSFVFSRSFCCHDASLFLQKSS